MANPPNAVIVGASSGIGAALARAMAGRGYPVALVARREDQLNLVASEIDRIAGRKLAHVYTSSVTDYEAIPALFHQIIAEMGDIDIVVYAAGVMPRVEPNEYSFEKDRQIIETNVIGAMAWLNVAAARFEKQKAGTIIGISSVAADRGRRGTPAYNTSKAALDTYLEALRNRLTRFGVHVLTIKPGFVATDMLIGAKLPPVPKPISAEAAAAQILAALDDNAQVAYIPAVWKWVGMVLKNLPSPIMRRLNI